MSRYIIHEDNEQKLSSYVCSDYFRPIELYLQKKYYSMSMDVWSAACVIGTILLSNKSINYLFTDKHATIIYDIFRKLGTPTENYCSEVLQWPLFDKKTPVWSRIGFTTLQTDFPKITDILYKMLDYIPIKELQPNKHYPYSMK